MSLLTFLTFVTFTMAALAPSNGVLTRQGSNSSSPYRHMAQSRPSRLRSLAGSHVTVSLLRAAQHRIRPAAKASMADPVRKSSTDSANNKDSSKANPA
ncbi:MAG: hypothetical protein IPL11_03950 [Candidatus Accumulibacter sp.]|nr:hypothetical protein [Accumulibacter sp.]